MAITLKSIIKNSLRSQARVQELKGKNAWVEHTLADLYEDSDQPSMSSSPVRKSSYSKKELKRIIERDRKIAERKDRISKRCIENYDAGLKEIQFMFSSIERANIQEYLIKLQSVINKTHDLYESRQIRKLFKQVKSNRSVVNEGLSRGLMQPKDGGKDQVELTRIAILFLKIWKLELVPLNKGHDEKTNLIINLSYCSDNRIKKILRMVGPVRLFFYGGLVCYAAAIILALVSVVLGFSDAVSNELYMIFIIGTLVNVVAIIMALSHKLLKAVVAVINIIHNQKKPSRSSFTSIMHSKSK